jgi:endogenous inhibitor of DNA gyrase (YacG/DUF329 family)
MSEKTYASWSLSLDCECPGCHKYVDLLDDSEFWDCHQSLKICESSTDKSRDVEVLCPECGHEFLVDLEY